jgi:hypothetical protein
VKLNPNHPALSEARTIHPKRVFDPVEYNGNVLKSVASNKKLGNGSNTITKGKWKGMVMYSLTLEERDTCPRSCHHWADCYGNGMAFGHRFKAGMSLEMTLEAELATLAKKHPNGFVVRLHVLGDFYSERYVRLWDNALQTYPNLHVFGYSARHSDMIGMHVALLNAHYPDRCWIRFSRKDSWLDMSAVEVPSKHSITCPEQLGKTSACITCGLCWSIKAPIHFISHDKVTKEKQNGKQIAL